MEPNLPKELVEALEQKKADMKHNWMYSFMPATNGERAVYLVAYCKVCDNGVTVRLSTDSRVGKAIVTRANVPKWGCSPVQELD